MSMVAPHIVGTRTVGTVLVIISADLHGDEDLAGAVVTAGMAGAVLAIMFVRVITLVRVITVTQAITLVQAIVAAITLAHDTTAVIMAGSTDADRRQTAKYQRVSRSPQLIRWPD